MHLHKMVSDVENASPEERIEECKIADSDVLASKKKLKLLCGSVSGLKQIAMDIHVV